MSKLYKELKYDTDRVMQPGDPLTSLDGNTQVNANDDGTATLTTLQTTQKENCVKCFINDGRGWNCWFRFRNTLQELSDDNFIGPITLSAAAVSSYGSEPSTGYSEYTATRNLEGDGEWRFSSQNNHDLDDVGLLLSSSYYGGNSLCAVIFTNDSAAENDFSFTPYTYEVPETVNKTISTTDQLPTLPLSAANGGTGIDGSSQAANKVLASPSNGTGAISCRPLVAADIPDLNTSKLTAGTLGVARGGTGKSSHTINSVIIGGTSTTGALQNVATASGAFYATSADVKPQFGTLPVEQGGTGATTASAALTALGAAEAEHKHSFLYIGTTDTNASLTINTNGDAYVNKLTPGNGGAIKDPEARGSSRNTVVQISGQVNDVFSQQPNKVLAGPSSGSTAGDISFRALVAADIPNLSANKITSDTLDIARIPTGTGSNQVALGNHTHNSLRSSAATTVYSTMEVDDAGNVYLTANDNSPMLQAPAPRGAGYTLVKILGTESGIQFQQAHKVLAGPSSGNTGPVSFRTLVASDLPSHTHTSLQSGSYTATPPTLTADKTLAITDDLNILPIITSTALSITMTADKYMYKVTDSGNTGIFPTLTAPTGLPASCYYKFEMEWVTASPTVTYAQTASTTPAMKWITSPVMQTDGLTHTYHISGRYDTTTSTFWMSCWKIDDAAGTITPDSHTLKYLLTTPTQVVSTTTTSNDTITVQLTDHAINAVDVPVSATNVVMKFPGQAIGKARDFFVRLIVTGSTVPSITLTEPDGSAIDFDVDDDSWTEIEQGVNLLMFTETAQ